MGRPHGQAADNGSVIASPPRLLADRTPTEDGWLVIPHILPIHVPQEALVLTVAEWLNLPPEVE